MSDWAVILGASSGFGGATAKALARAGLDIMGIHLDRKSTLDNVEAIKNDIVAAGRQAIFINMNAADGEKRGAAVAQLQAAAGPDGRVKVLLHSLAFGALKPVVADDPKAALSQAQVEMTLDVMASSLLYWTQDLHRAGLLKKGSQIFGMTSSGGHRQWASYGAVSAAKAALESYMRQLAVELAPEGIAANTIQAGVTDTPALRKIPGNVEMLERATELNPGNRLTTPEDVARAITMIGLSEDTWLTGNIIRIDGGEDIVG
ncbi:MAG: SDR family oxidoreductase [Candidatus Marinimicrobia bacterium]|nr:SDR family oxidoreductase [Candidatus Neomarinimicrobiota bacterium]